MYPRRSRKYFGLALVSLLLLIGAVGCVPDEGGVWVSMDEEGMTDDGVAYDMNDILFIDTEAATPEWMTIFDGEEVGLNDRKHDIYGFSFNEAVFNLDDLTTTTVPELELYLSFEANRALVPGITDRVYGQDIVKYTGPASTGTTVDPLDYNYELFFDGSDVGLTTISEKLDGISVWPPEYYDMITANDIEIPFDCPAAVIFVSTRGSYRVPNNLGGQLVGDGSDVLAFCATNTGLDTAGFWLRVFDSSLAEIDPPGAISGLDVWFIDPTMTTADDAGNADIGVAFFFTSRKPFSGLDDSDATLEGEPNELFIGAGMVDDAVIEGPYANFDDGVVVPAVNGPVDSVSIFDFMFTITSASR